MGGRRLCCFSRRPGRRRMMAARFLQSNQPGFLMISSTSTSLDFIKDHNGITNYLVFFQIPG